MAAKKGHKKKKRISKHVLKAQAAKAAATVESADLTHTVNVISSTLGEEKSNKSTATVKKRQIQKQHQKDPNGAASYLSAWKHRAAGGVWKFNKNTQSWLIRHMYDAKKITKATFATLLEYLIELAPLTKERVIVDAKRRTTRYKEYDKQQSDDNTTENTMRTNYVDQARQDTRDRGSQNDETHWKRLNDHDKRREYKRARKVLETLVEMKELKKGGNDYE
jgi:hypothetical protein